ncbi:MAG: glycosyltransferase family 2 protein [Actinomycetota bacterium]|nr:glycosyltransferase family 2 protein [Actinomycetota bacterium]
MKVSVVTVEYHSWPYTLRCIDSLYKTGYEDFEVVVVDNGQGTPPETMVRPVRLIRNPKNVGFAKACNQGISASTGEYVAFINPDTLVERDFFVGLEKFFDENPKAGVAGPRIVDDEGHLQLSARKELSLLSGLVGRTSLLTRLFPKSPLVRRHFPATEEPTGPPAEVDWISGACMVVRRTTLEEVGSMDERFFMYFEDADLCRRTREAGWLVYYLPQIEVLHHTGASSLNRPKAIWDLHRSAFLYHRKHGPHGPLGLYSLLVLVGLTGRALVRLATSALKRSSG